jgi:hypothetical protein
MIRIDATPGERLEDLPRSPIEIDPVMVTNIPKGRTTPPLGAPWQYFIFGTEHRSHGVERRILITVTGESQDYCDQQLVHLIDHHPNLKVPVAARPARDKEP